MQNQLIFFLRWISQLLTIYQLVIVIHTMSDKKILFMSNILRFFHVYSLVLCLFLTGPEITFYNIVNLKNLIPESIRINPPSDIFWSALSKSETSENVIRAILMQSKWQLQTVICLLPKIWIVWCVQKEDEITENT